MFRSLQKIALFGVAIGLLTACQKEGEQVVLPDAPSASITATPSSMTVAPDRTNLTGTALTMRWNAVNYGATVPVRYVVQFDKKGGNFAAPAEISAANSTSVAISSADMNKALVQLGIAPGTTGQVDARVKSEIVTIPDRANVKASYSPTLTLTGTAFTNTTYLYVPGDYQGWAPDKAPRLTSPNGDGMYEGYVYFSKASPFKLTSAPDWNHTNYGTGGTGKLSTTGDNLTITEAGYYRIEVDQNKLTWKATKTQWGVIGAATPKGWDASTPMTFDPTTNTWKVDVALKADELKFRANDAWDINLGDNKPANGFLTYGGENIKVATAGTYTLTLNLNEYGKYTYSLTKK
ncbi:hypothetical protein FAES_3563 [Fibrella aestuarina BUZ 2]|uniref:SusE outer membrane protein domain-containing protein n=1 Tax=Fibrella aestuarina BUZ 2 TaxID=1166018 RepID=I0KBR7_9BACT|nr:SusE domain-containing protein [Fibrella aestuarina]CCH01570.1 hypothetical protein FAES_3563 [Fibrella aestuarina BUZ 2]